MASCGRFYAESRDLDGVGHGLVRVPIDAMLSDLLTFKGKTGFGIINRQNGRDFALDLETKIYNAWVRAQCEQLNVMVPGELADEDFADRYWMDDDD